MSETEHLFPSGLHITKATKEELHSTHQWNIIDPLYIISVSTIRELVIVRAAIAGLFLFFFLQVLFSYCLLLFSLFSFFFNFAFNFFPSVACFCLKERLSNYVQTIIWDICRQDRCPIWYLERNQASPGTRTLPSNSQCILTGTGV